MYRMFEFDITDIARPGSANALAVEVFPPTEDDLTLTFVDWNPMPPDKDMGLVRDVYILSTGPVAMRNTQVITRLDNPPDNAHLTIFTDVRNSSDRPGDFHGALVCSTTGLFQTHPRTAANHPADLTKSY